MGVAVGGVDVTIAKLYQFGINGLRQNKYFIANTYGPVSLLIGVAVGMGVGMDVGVGVDVGMGVARILEAGNFPWRDKNGGILEDGGIMEAV